MSEDNPTIDPAEQTAEVVPAARTDMSVPEMREWLRNWVANATGQSPDGINESAPMVELGLSSRDAVAMASDIEDLTGVALTATVAFRHPTIEALAQVIVEGEPEEDIADLDAEQWVRKIPVPDGEYDILTSRDKVVNVVGANEISFNPYFIDSSLTPIVSGMPTYGLGMPDISDNTDTTKDNITNHDVQY